MGNYTLQLYNLLKKNLFASSNSTPASITSFGHQADLAYGFTWPYEKNATLRTPSPNSDVYFATNKKWYPRVFGFDIGNINHDPPGLNVDKLWKGDIKKWVR